MVKFLICPQMADSKTAALHEQIRKWSIAFILHI